MLFRSVLLTIDINEQGEVENIRVVDGEQRETFQGEARHAVSQWKYKPTLLNGEPVEVQTTVTVNFSFQQ